MTRNVTLQLDEFGQRALDHFVKQGQGSPEATLRTAALYYLAEGDAKRAAWRAPRFRSRPDEVPGLRVAFDDETWAALEQEARRQGIGPEPLAVHALPYFLADFESGRLAGRLGQTLGEDE